jgi:integrase
MPTINLTEKELDAIKGTDKLTHYYDENLPGFGFYTRGKMKSYFVKGRVGKQQVMYTLGKVNSFESLKEARKEAGKILNGMKDGIDPRVERRKRLEETEREHANAKEEERKNLTLLEAFEQMVEIRKKKLKPRTIETYRYLLQHYFPDWIDESLRKISKSEVETRFRKITETGATVSANNAFRTFRLIWNFANVYHEGILGENPVSRLGGLKLWNPVEPRKREIPSDKLQLWYESVKRLNNPTSRDFLLLVLFTGMRRKEAASLKWDSIDFERRTLTVSDTKNKIPLVLPLSSFVYDLLKNRYENLYEGPYVFPGSYGAEHFSEPKRAVRVVSQETGIQFSSHDLRRTLTSLCMDLLIHPYIMDALINHVSKGKKDVTRDHYAVITVDRMRVPAQQLCDHIMKLVGITCSGSAKVINMEERRFL